MPLDLRLYLLTDPSFAWSESELPALVKAGVTLVQLRDKHASDDALRAQAEALLEVLTPLGVPLIINDRVEVARAVGAAGVHVGQSDSSVARCRAAMGGSGAVGLSIEHPEQPDQGADYIAASPVFGTPTKEDTAPPLGLDGVRVLANRGGPPVVAIGGMGPERAGRVTEAGAAGVAVISAVWGASDRPRAVRAIRAEVDAALDRRGR